MGHIDIVQARNPMTGRWIKIDRYNALIVSSKKTPYKNISIVGETRESLEDVDEYNDSMDILYEHPEKLNVNIKKIIKEM